jgi:hypothetical protein
MLGIASVLPLIVILEYEFSLNNFFDREGTYQAYH